LGWRLDAIPFLLPLQQAGLWAGIIGLSFLVPPALTSFDGFIQRSWWRWVHGLTAPALLLVVAHTILVGSRYLGGLEWMAVNKLQTAFLLVVTLGVFLLRSHWVWSILSVQKHYGSSR
jgi:uncharacterized protein